jgi:hypothetical protein
MIRILMIGFAILGVVWLILRFMGSNILGRGKSRSDFSHAVRSLLVLMENGGVLRVRHRGSKTEFNFVREAGTDESAELLLVIPRAEWSEKANAALRQAFDTHGYKASFDGKNLAEIRIGSTDIWDEASGARGARAAHILVDALSIPRDARFDLALLGPMSRRIALRHAKQVAG